MSEYIRSFSKFEAAKKAGTPILATPKFINPDDDSESEYPFFVGRIEAYSEDDVLLNDGSCKALCPLEVYKFSIYDDEF